MDASYTASPQLPRHMQQQQQAQMAASYTGGNTGLDSERLHEGLVGFRLWRAPPFCPSVSWRFEEAWEMGI